MNEEEMIKRIAELEERLEKVNAHNKALEKATRESFSKLMEILSRFTSATNKINEVVVTDLEKRSNQSQNYDNSQEIIDRLEKIEERFENLEQEIEDKVYENTAANQSDLIKIAEKQFEFIKQNRDAINEIINYIKERDKVTVTKILLSLSSLRSLLGSL